MDSADAHGTARRRGRPYRYPEDTSPFHQVHGGVDLRASWLLSASRIHAGDSSLAHRDRFVEVLKAQGTAADQGRVSRWESGVQRVPDRVVAAYEKALGLAPTHLGSTINGLRRSLEPGGPDLDAVITTPEHLHEDLDRLFDTVEGGDGGHGADWLALTSYLASRPQVYMRPKTWTQLTESLIGQLGRSVGTAYNRRFEALRTLVRHTGAQRHVVKSIGAFVTDPAAQVVMHPLTLLQEVSHPGAADVTLRMLTAGSGMLQQGAAWTTAAKLARGHLDEPAVKKLEGVLLMLLGSGSRSLIDVDVLDVVARMPEPSRALLRRAVTDPDTVPRLDTMLRTGEMLSPDVTRPVSARIAEAAQQGTPSPYRIEPDMMLQRLVREALFHGHQERRHQAAVLLHASPYRAAVAAALVDVVEARDDLVGLQAGLLLRYLATENERPVLLRWAANPQRPKIRGIAILTLGRLPDGVRHEDETVVLTALDGASRLTQRACLYALGMSGSRRLLSLMDTDSDFQKRAVEWWLRTGPALHEPSSGTFLS